MITDKDMEDKNDAYDVALKILSLGNTESTPGNIADIINKHATDSAEQARKEAAERVASAWREHREDITLRILREAILGDSVIKENSITDHIPDIGKKLAIAVKALEKIRSDACVLFGIHHPALDAGFGPAKDIIQTVDRTMKEIQG